jgi:DNA repair photolyase
VLVKVNAIDLLRKELASKRVKGTIGTGSMHDPYMPLERKVHLTGRALQVIAEFRFPVHVVTKSDLVLRDLELLKQISDVYAAVSFTITTADDTLASKLEPGAPPPSARFKAMRQLSANGILTGVSMMPILPFIEDTDENVYTIVTRAHECGASYFIPWFGMTLRDRQREYYYRELDRSFPGVRDLYDQTYGERYKCPVPNASRLAQGFDELCRRLGIATRIPQYGPQQALQLRLI